jgi:hypothetical protein
MLLLPGSPASVAQSVSNPSDDDRLTGKVDFDFEDLGTKSLKNITSPIRVYRSDGKIVEKTADAPGSPRFDDSPCHRGAAIFES